MTATPTTTTTPMPRTRRRTASQPVPVGPCDQCLGDTKVPIDGPGLFRARQRGRDPLPTQMPCPKCRTENGSTGVRRLADLRDNAYVPDYLPRHWSEAASDDPADPVPPRPQKADAAPYVRAIKAEIRARQAARRQQTR